MKHIVRQIPGQLICLIVAITCLFPLFWMLSSSLKTSAEVFSSPSVLPSVPQWKNYLTAWVNGGFGVYFFNSVLYTTVTVFGILFIASLAAYAISRLQFFGKNLLFLLFIIPMMIPIPGAFISLYVLLNNLGLINTRTGYILCQINAGIAFGIFLLKTFFDEVPKELEEAGVIDGCNKWQLYRYIALPLAKPALAVVAIFNILAVWNEYLLAMLIFSDKDLMPLQRGLMIFYGEHIADYSVLMAGISITTIPVVIIYFFMQKHIISGITAGALKG